MANFDYPELDNYPTMQTHDNHPYQNYFQANPVSNDVQVSSRSSGYVQPRKIQTMNVHGEDPKWIDRYQIPCGTILPQSLYYNRSKGIILPP